MQYYDTRTNSLVAKVSEDSLYVFNNDNIKEIRNEIEQLFPSRLNCKLKFLETTCSAAYFLPAAIKPKSEYLKKKPKEIQIEQIAKMSGVFDKIGIAMRFKDMRIARFKKLNK